MSSATPFESVPDHLQEAMDMEAQQAAVEAAAEVAKPKFDPADPKAQAEYTFDFKWEDRRGRLYKGSFTSRILSLGQQSQAGIFQARLSRGIPYDQLDPVTREINYLIARLAFALDKKSRPPWASDLGAIQSLELLQALYAEVASHESTFHGYVAPSE